MGDMAFDEYVARAGLAGPEDIGGACPSGG